MHDEKNHFEAIVFSKPGRWYIGAVGASFVGLVALFLPSFLNEFWSEKHDLLGSVAFPALLLSLGACALSLAVRKGRGLAYPIAALAFSALLVAAWYFQALS